MWGRIFSVQAVSRALAQAALLMTSGRSISYTAMYFGLPSTARKRRARKQPGTLASAGTCSLLYQSLKSCSMSAAMSAVTM
jgi:hypothetical protein